MCMHTLAMARRHLVAGVALPCRGMSTGGQVRGLLDILKKKLILTNKEQPNQVTNTPSQTDQDPPRAAPNQPQHQHTVKKKNK